MRMIGVQAFEDPSKPEGGHAVILLRGLATAPDRPAFRLRPVDATAAGPGDWPDDWHQAILARTTEQGVELVIGPEVADSPLLLPGTAVEIELPDLAVRGEFLWPSVTPLARPRRRSIIARRTGREVGLAPPAVGGEALPSTNLPTAQPPTPATARSALPSAAGTAADLSRNRHSPVARPPMPSTVPSQSTSYATPAEPLSPGALAGAPPTEAAEAKPEYVVWYPHARGGRMAGAPQAAATPRPARRSLTASPIGLAALAVTGMLLAQGVTLFLLGGQIPGFGGKADTGAAATTGNSAVATANSTLPTGPTGDPTPLYDALSVGRTSPRGVSARDLDQNRVLELANARLHASGAARDTEEGQFWLKRYVVAGLGDDRTLRVLTQLGSIYAEPAGRAPDYVKARHLWELASAAGDPIAMCFLGMLHENGLGFAVDKGAALNWYERGKQSGGCPAVDEAIARARK